MTILSGVGKLGLRTKIIIDAITPTTPINCPNLSWYVFTLGYILTYLLAKYPQPTHLDGVQGAAEQRSEPY